MTQLDSIDKAILKELQYSAKKNVKEIAAIVGLSITPTYERIKRLEQQGVIKSYVAVLDKEKIGKSLEVFCHVTLNSHSKTLIKNFEKSIVKIEDVIECYHVTGNSDYLVKVLVSNIQEYQEFIIDKISTIDNVSNVQSAFVMTNVKSNTAISF